MKKTLGVVGSLLVTIISATSFAQSSAVCEGVAPIVVSRDTLRNNPIQEAILHYSQHSCLNNTAYCLCFQYPDGELDMVLDGLNLDSSANGKPVHIDGLRLRAFVNTLSLTGAQPITLSNSNFSGCADCLLLNGNNFKVENVKVTCSEKESGGVGIKLAGEGHQILNTTLQNCGVGVQIGDETGLVGNNMKVGPDVAADATTKKVTASANGTGFKIVNGDFNYIKFDSAFDNQRVGEQGYPADAGINGGLFVPVLIKNMVQRNGETVEEYLKYDTTCDPTSEWSATATLQFKIPSPFRIPFSQRNKKNMEISLTDGTPQNPLFQGKTFFKDAICTTAPDGTGQLATCKFLMSFNYAEKEAVLLFHHPILGTSNYSIHFFLNGCGPGVFAAPDLEPGAGVAQGGGVAMPGGAVTLGGGSDGGGFSGGYIPQPSSLPPPAAPEEKNNDGGSSGNSIGASLPSGGSATEVLSGGVSATGATGGLKVGGCMLNDFKKMPESGDSRMGIVALVVLFIFTLRCHMTRKKKMP
ncbi:MAG: hypothetical protein Q7T03_07370 [Deltaproteobacteria bacterium]|nr:hypothetical protein [Deltaproteobacteria bacterium]